MLPNRIGLMQSKARWPGRPVAWFSRARSRFFSNWCTFQAFRLSRFKTFILPQKYGAIFSGHGRFFIALYIHTFCNLKLFSLKASMLQFRCRPPPALRRPTLGRVTEGRKRFPIAALNLIAQIRKHPKRAALQITTPTVQATTSYLKITK